MSTETINWTPEYESWRHGGWYVVNIRYPTGAVGCVSRNYPDKKWRIVCDDRRRERTYPTRDIAAKAERALAEADIGSHNAKKPWLTA